MSDLEKLYNQEIERVAVLLKAEDPTRSTYPALLRSLETLHQLRSNQQFYTMPTVSTTSVPTVTTTSVTTAVSESAVDEPVSEPVQTTTEVVEDEDEEEPEQEALFVDEPEEAPITYTSTAVRKKLSDAAARGVNIKPIITKFVPDGKAAKFSEIPKKNYPALVTEIEMEIANAQ